MTPRERRIVGGALISLLAVALLRGVPQAWSGIRRLEEVTRAREEALARMRREVIAMDSLRQASESLLSALSERRELLVQASTAAEAQASMLDVVREAVEEADATLEQAAAVADSTSVGPLRRSTCRVALQTDTDGLAVVIANLATTDVLLEVTSIKVAALDPRSPPGQPERLHVELSIAAWFSEKTPDDSIRSIAS